MPQHHEKKLTKSKKWIDYSSQEENDHHEEEKPHKQHHHHHHQKLESKFQVSEQKNKKHDDDTKPVLSISHEPVKEHLLEDRKDLLEQLRQIRGNSVWIVLSVNDQKNAGFLNEKIDELKKANNKQILSIYPSRDNKNAFDLRVEIDLCEKWIVEGFDQKNIVGLSLRRKLEQNQQQGSRQQGRNYEERDRDYRLVKQSHPQHTTSTRYEPRHVQYKEKPQQPSKKPTYRESTNNNHRQRDNNNTQQQKKKYIEKNPLAEQMEQKVEEQLRERKLNKKENEKKAVQQGSKFYSKNPFEMNDSD